MLVRGHNFQTLPVHSLGGVGFGVSIPDISVCLRPLYKSLTEESGLGQSH